MDLLRIFFYFCLLSLFSCSSGNKSAHSSDEKESLRRAFRTNGGAYSACYLESVKKTRSKESLQIRVKLIIDPSGSVTNSHLESKKNLPLILSSCLERVLSKTKFPKSKDGQFMTFEAPLNFSVKSE